MSPLLMHQKISYTIYKNIYKETPSIYTLESLNFFHGQQLGNCYAKVLVYLIFRVTVEKFGHILYEDNDIITCCFFLEVVSKDSKDERRNFF